MERALLPLKELKHIGSPRSDGNGSEEMWIQIDPVPRVYHQNLVRQKGRLAEILSGPFGSFRALSDFSNWTKQALRSFPKNTEPLMWKALRPESPECKAPLWFSKSVEYSVLFASTFLQGFFLQARKAAQMYCKQLTVRTWCLGIVWVLANMTPW